MAATASAVILSLAVLKRGSSNWKFDKEDKEK